MAQKAWMIAEALRGLAAEIAAAIFAACDKVVVTARKVRARWNIWAKRKPAYHISLQLILNNGSCAVAIPLGWKRNMNSSFS